MGGKSSEERDWFTIRHRRPTFLVWRHQEPTLSLDDAGRDQALSLGQVALLRLRRHVARARMLPDRQR